MLLDTETLGMRSPRVNNDMEIFIRWISCEKIPTRTVVIQKIYCKFCYCSDVWNVDDLSYMMTATISAVIR